MKRDLLILGAGGLVSQGIIKSLEGRYSLVGADIYPDSPGLFRVDTAVICPAADDEQFLEWLRKTIKKYKIKGILTGVEPILDVLSRNRERIKARCVVSPPGILEIGQDKMKTAQWLKANALPYPKTLFPGMPPIRFWDRATTKLLAKPHRGRGSSGLVYLTTIRQFYDAIADGLMVQEVVGTEDQEYTVGCFCDRNGKLVNLICLKRGLFAGTTFVAEISHEKVVLETARAIIEELKPIGPCNLQMRLADGVAYTFEINMRFSSSTPIRAHFGFNESQAAVDHFLLDRPITSLNPRASGYVLRYFNEMYIPEGSMRRLKERGEVDRPWNGVTIQSWV